jgi:UDP-N-acetylmuramate dehydrogenase
MLLVTKQGSATWTAAALADIERAARRGGIAAVRDEPLRRHTSFGVGGPCPLMLFPESPHQFMALSAWAGERDLASRVLGGGTNLLVADQGVPEPVLNTTRMTAGIMETPDHVVFPAGLPTARALYRTVAAGLDGLVWASGLPGTLGGAAAGNAGCWGGDMAGCTEFLDVVDGRGQLHHLQRADLTWTYRALALPDRVVAPWFIVTVAVRVEPGDGVALRKSYDALQARKRASQPLGARNSGCIFRNPEAGAAGALLDAAGCKGMRVGGAVVSERHANFIVNDRDASAADIDGLIARLAAAAASAGVTLREEIRRW